MTKKDWESQFLFNSSDAQDWQREQEGECSPPSKDGEDTSNLLPANARTQVAEVLVSSRL